MQSGRDVESFAVVIGVGEWSWNQKELDQAVVNRAVELLRVICHQPSQNQQSREGFDCVCRSERRVYFTRKLGGFELCYAPYVTTTCTGIPASTLDIRRLPPNQLFFLLR